jgi:hypothetical protein
MHGLRQKDATDPYKTTRPSLPARSPCLLTIAIYVMLLKPQHLVGFGNLSRTPLSSTRFIRASDASTTAMTNTGQSFANFVTDTSTKMSKIVHIVLFQFKPEVSPETVLDVH